MSSTSTHPTVALAGATGSLGSAVLSALLDASIHVTALTRQGSSSTSSMPKHHNLTIKQVDYNSPESLQSALKGIDVIISTITTGSVKQQETLVDAAVAAGVTRFVPSDFGCDLHNENNRKLPVYGDKIKIKEYIKRKTEEHPSFSYTGVDNGAFLDWGLKMNFLVNVKEHKATFYDGGDRRFSTTRLSTVAKAIVGVVKNLDGTKNRDLLIHDGVATQKQLVEAVKKHDGKEWETQTKSLEETERESYAILKSGDHGRIMEAMFGFLYVALFGGEKHGSAFKKVDNELVGLEVLSEEEFQKVVEEAAAGL